MKIKKGDKVKVTTGKYKGTEGLVTKTLPKKSLVMVEGVNVKKRAVKQSDSNNENYLYIQHPIHVSNVAKLEGEVVKAEAKKTAKPAKKTTAKKK